VAAVAGGAREVLNLDFSPSALSLGRRNALLNGQRLRPDEEEQLGSFTELAQFLDAAPAAEAPTGIFSTLRADAVPSLRAYAGLKPILDRRRGGGGSGGGRGGGERGRRGPGGARSGGWGGGAGGGGAVSGRWRQVEGSSPRVPGDGAFGKPRFGRKFDLIVLDPPTWATSASGMTVDLVRDYQSLFKPAVLALKPGGSVLATNHVSAVEMDEWLDSLERCADKAGKKLKSLEPLKPEADFPSPDGKHPLKIAIATIE